MTITAGRMIDEVIGLLESWSLDEEQATTLAVDMAVDDTSFTVTEVRGQATGISPGLVEIEQELLYASSIDASGLITVTPWGRGIKSTTATAHTAGTKVTSQPTFPRAKAMDEINQVLERVFPSVWAVRQVELTTTTPQITYALPDDAQWVLDAKWQVPDGRLYWQDVFRWRVSPGGGTRFGDQGVTVDIADSMTPGQPLQIVYAAKPAPLVNESDDFVGVTGLNLGLRDVVTCGAAASMVISQELSRLQMATVEQQNRAQTVAPSAALTSSRALEQRFQQRLLEERRSLQRLYPPRVTRAWK